MLNLSGYMPCSCRDCFEFAIGEYTEAKTVLCLACEEAGCDGGECRAPGAYGGDDGETDE